MLKDGTIQNGHLKEMYVSPFIDMNQYYRFTLRPPNEKLSIKIRQSGDAGETLIATQNAKSVALSDANFVKCLLMYPLMTLKIILAIHWEALLLFFRGTKFWRYDRSYRKSQK